LETFGEWISSEMSWAVADWIVVIHFTEGIHTTDSFTRILTSVIDTSFVGVTFVIGYTFWAAPHVWISFVTVHTGTLGNVVLD